MRSNKNKSIIAVIVAAVIAIVCGVLAITSGTRKTDNGDFNGTYSLNACAASRITTMNVLGNTVDVVNIDPLTSEDGQYVLYITVIDTADLAGLNVNLGYGFGENVYNNIEQEGLTNVVYSSITSGESTLTMSDIVNAFGLSSERFAKPYFAIVEMKKSIVSDFIGSLIFAEKHTVELADAGKASTCTEHGYKAYYTCTNDGCTKLFADKYGIKEITDLTAWKEGDGKLALAAHTEVIDEAVDPTCTEDGLTQGSHCSECGTVIVAQQADPAKGHTPVDIPAEDPTCTESGLTAGSYCSVCNTVLKAQSTVPANGHNEVTDEAVAPTCTQTGLTQGSHCSDCGEILVAQTEVPALGHNYVNFICDRDGCGDLQKVDVNGVYYQFTAANEKYNNYHFVACGKAPDFYNTEKHADYTNSANTLVLENSIGGYRVTEIGFEALSNAGGDTSSSIKNVIIPANIVTIDKRAFLDNYGMLSAVFLAKEVTVLGSFAEKDDAGKQTPFYGCSTSDGGISTSLIIYYSSVVYYGEDGSNDLTWTLFRQVKSGATYDRYYVGCDPKGPWGLIDYDHEGGGAIYANGSWSYVNTVISGNELVTECSLADLVAANVNNGIYFNADNKVVQYTQTQGDELKTKLEEALSGYTNDSGANKYVVNVTVTNVNINATVAIRVSLNVPVEVQVNSAVAFSYDLEGQSISAGLTKMKVIKSGDNVILYDPVATDTTYNYTFLGWAKEVDGVLKFIESTTEYNKETVYYAIWGASKVKSTTFTVSDHTTGSNLSAPSKGEDSEYQIDGKWYDDSWSQVTEISTANTVVYTRSIFTLKVYLSGKAAQTNSLHVGNDISATSLGGSTSITINVLEGTLSVSIDANNQVITIVNNNKATEIYVVEMALKWFEYKETGTKRTISYSFDACFVDGNMVGSGQLTIKVK